MKAMIYAAGLGTRLRPLTDDRPKALIEVGGKPMLQHVIENIKKAGITRAVVNVHHFAGKVIDFLDRNGNFGIDIAISDESDRLLDTGGGLLQARPLLDGDEPILLHNADILTDLDLRLMKMRGDATLLVGTRGSSRRLVFDHNDGNNGSADGSDMMQLCGWIDTASGATRPDGFIYDPSRHTTRSFNGIHLFSPALFPTLEDYSRSAGSDAFSITPFYVAASGTHSIYATEPDGYSWFDIGRPETLAAADRHLRDRN